jgi:hypothetical protein
LGPKSYAQSSREWKQCRCNLQEQLLVELESAILGKDTTGVGLERHLVSLDGDGSRRSVEGDLHVANDLRGSLSAVVRNVSIVDDLSFTLSSVVSACVVSSSVRIVGVQFLASRLQVIPSVVVPATIATLVTITGGTIDELLRRENIKSISNHALSGLDRLSSGEGPARSTLSLILNGSNARALAVVTAV